MKRADLTFGHEYLYATTADWTNHWRTPSRVRLIAPPTEKWESPEWSSQHSKVTVDGTEHVFIGRRSTTATGVLVAVLDDHLAVGSVKVVPIGHLRAPWAEGAKVYRDAQAVKARQAEEARERETRTADRVEAVRSAVEERIGKTAHLFSVSSGARVSIDLADLETLLGLR